MGFVHDQHFFRRVNDYVPLQSDVKGDGNKTNRMPKYLLTAFDHWANKMGFINTMPNAIIWFLVKSSDFNVKISLWDNKITTRTSTYISLLCCCIIIRSFTSVTIYESNKWLPGGPSSQGSQCFSPSLFLWNVNLLYITFCCWSMGPINSEGNTSTGLYKTTKKKEV